MLTDLPENTHTQLASEHQPHTTVFAKTSCQATIWLLISICVKTRSKKSQWIQFMASLAMSLQILCREMDSKCMTLLNEVCWLVEKDIHTRLWNKTGHTACLCGTGSSRLSMTSSSSSSAAWTFGFRVRLPPFFMLRLKYQEFEDKTVVSRLSLWEDDSFPTFEDFLPLAEK